MTRQKRALGQALSDAQSFLSARELHQQLLAAGETLGLATVYGQLKQLASEQFVDVVRSESGEFLYRRCGSNAHHHHLVCRSCGKSVELDAPEMERLSHRLAEQEGFSDLAHVLELTGICSSCRP